MSEKDRERAKSFLRINSHPYFQLKAAAGANNVGKGKKKAKPLFGVVFLFSIRSSRDREEKCQVRLKLAE
jgi:hypothetical protein